MLLVEGEILVHIFLRAMILPQKRLTQVIEPHLFLERQASKYFVALKVCAKGSYFFEVYALHVRKYKHLDLLLIGTAKVCRNTLGRIDFGDKCHPVAP